MGVMKPMYAIARVERFRRALIVNRYEHPLTGGVQIGSFANTIM